MNCRLLRSLVTVAGVVLCGLNNGAEAIDFEIVESFDIPNLTAIRDVRDMDGDGEVDVVARIGPTLHVFEMSGGTMVSKFSIAASRGSTVADVDGDGRPEIAIANGVFPSTLTVYEATADDTYGVIFSQSDFHRAIEGDPVTGDSDNDGLLEYLVAQEGVPSRVRIIESASDNTFAEIPGLTGNRDDSHITGVADLHGDQVNEVVFSDNGGTPNMTLRVFENGSPVYENAAGLARALGDTDGDGVMEIVVAKNSGGLLFLGSDSVDDFIELADMPAESVSFIVDILKDETLDLIHRSGADNNVLSFSNRSGTALESWWESGTLFQDSTAAITNVILLDDTNEDGLEEFAVLQGDQVHIVQEKCCFSSLVSGPQYSHFRFLEKLLPLSLARRFRDEVMSKSAEGRSYIALYYKHGPEMTRMMLRHPVVAASSVGVLARLSRKIRHAVDGQPTTMTVADIAACENVLDLVSQHASPELRKTLDHVRSDLHSATVGRLFVAAPDRPREP